MLVVCGWSIWTPPVIRVDTHTRRAVLCLPFPNLRWVSFELIWGVIWAHMRCHLSSYETSFELMWAHLISNNLKWHLIWDLIWDVKWDQTRLGRGIEKLEVEKSRWHFRVNHYVVKQPTKYEFLIPSGVKVGFLLVNRMSLIFKVGGFIVHMSTVKPKWTSSFNSKCSSQYTCSIECKFRLG